MKVKNSQILETITAINSIGDLKQAPKAVFALAKNLNKLKRAGEVIDEAKKTLWKQHFGQDTEVKKTDARLPKFNDELQKVLETEVDFSPHSIKLDELNLEVNSIIPSALSLVSWLIEDFDK